MRNKSGRNASVWRGWHVPRISRLITAGIDILVFICGMGVGETIHTFGG